MIEPRLTTSADILADYKATVRMLRDAAERYQRTQAEAVELQATIAALGCEKERLLRAIEEAVAFEEGLAPVELLNPPTVQVHPVVNAMNAAIEIDHGG